MGGLFSSPKPPDMSHIEEQRKEQERKAKEAEDKRLAREKALKASGSGVGRRSLLSGGEQGVTSGLKSTLG